MAAASAAWTASDRERVLHDVGERRDRANQIHRRCDAIEEALAAVLVANKAVSSAATPLSCGADASSAGLDTAARCFTALRDLEQASREAANEAAGPKGDRVSRTILASAKSKLDRLLATLLEAGYASELAAPPYTPPEPSMAPLAGVAEELAADVTVGGGVKGLRVVVMSDTHGLHGQIPLGALRCDVLVHCGDFTNAARRSEVESFNAWLAALPLPPSVPRFVVQGNHDCIKLSGLVLDNCEAACDFAKQAELLTAGILLGPGSVPVEVPAKAAGQAPLRILASGWGARSMHVSAAARFAGLDRCDLLVTHEPPKGVLDKSGKAGARSFGGVHEEDVMASLQATAAARATAAGGRGTCDGCSQVAAFGHIHEAAGVLLDHPECPGVAFVNCAMANDGMRARTIERPWRVIDF